MPRKNQSWTIPSAVFVTAVAQQTTFHSPTKFWNLGNMPKTSSHALSTSRGHTTGFLVKSFWEWGVCTVPDNRQLLHGREAEFPGPRYDYLRVNFVSYLVTSRFEPWTFLLRKSLVTSPFISALTDLTKEALPSSFQIEAFLVSNFRRYFPLVLSLWTSSISCSGTRVTTTDGNL